MNMIESLQRLDESILEHTKPPVAAILRNQLSLIREQCEAYQAASDKQDNTLAKQIETIEKLQGEIAALTATMGVPFKVSDDYEFDTEGGFWIERKTGLRICASCILPPNRIVSPVFEAVGLGMDGEEALVWRCGNCRSDYFHKPIRISN